MLRPNQPRNKPNTIERSRTTWPRLRPPCSWLSRLPRNVRRSLRAFLACHASEVEAAIAKALNKPTGGADTPEDRRKFASCLVQLPLCEQQVQADTETIEKGKQAIAEKQKSVDDLSADNQFLRGKFQDLYNLKSTPVRSWKCLKLWRCVRSSDSVTRN
jgi:hypothetical protein